MTNQEAELLRHFRRNPVEAKDMIVRMTAKSADMFDDEMNAALESINQEVFIPCQHS